MNRIVIEPFQIATTQIGFGCSSLLGLLSERESRTLIDAAYDAGIRHFDVARSYGHGSAESLLGKTLGSRRANVTITTKFGLPVPKSQTLIRVARSLARPLAKRFAAVRSQSKSAVAAMAETVAFTREEATQSLAASLRDLRSDFIDLFLLHEVRADLLKDDGLLLFLQEAMGVGKIRGYGVGSDRSALPDLIRSRPEFCPVIQHQWSVTSPHLEIPPASFRVCHGALLRAFDTFREGMGSELETTSKAVGMDMSNHGNVAALLLRSAMLKYPGALLLFSARSPQRIQQNVASLVDSKLDPYCARLSMLLGAEKMLDLNR